LHVSSNVKLSDSAHAQLFSLIQLRLRKVNWDKTIHTEYRLAQTRAGKKIARRGQNGLIPTAAAAFTRLLPITSDS